MSFLYIFERIQIFDVSLARVDLNYVYFSSQNLIKRLKKLVMIGDHVIKKILSATFD